MSSVQRSPEFRYEKVTDLVYVGIQTVGLKNRIKK